MARLLAVLRGVDSLGLSLDQQLAVVMGRRDADTETARAQVSGDWRRAGHVTTLLTSDWSSCWPWFWDLTPSPRGTRLDTP